jgi:hypothetical protein
MLRYVPHHEIGRYLREGWTVTNDLADCYHGEFAVLTVRPDGQDMLTTTLALARSPVDGGPMPPCPAIS